MLTLRLAPSLLVLALCGCAALPRHPVSQATLDAAAAPAAGTPAAASAQLRALFAASDAAALKRNPLLAIQRGENRDTIGELYSDAYDAAERRAAEVDLNRLAGIDRALLSPEEQISYDVFAWQRRIDLRGLQPDLLATTRLLPLDHFGGLHTQFANLSSGEGSAPYKTVADYEAGLKRFDSFAAAMDRAVARMRQGEAAGVTQPKIVMQNVQTQLDALIEGGVEGGPYYRPIAHFPDSVPEAERKRLAEAYRQRIKDVVLPALTRTRDFIRDDYLPHARDSVGLGALKGGPELYRYLVEVNTTAPGDPEAIHQLGLSEVARIHAEMEAVKAQVGFKGTLAEFFDFIRTDPRFKPASREALTQGYRDVGAKVAPVLPRLFRTLPKTPLDIRPVGPLTEKGAARGSYEAGAPDGSRPGVFYFNAYDLPSRTTPAMTTLYLHEGAPGHHFQISLAQENASLPAFQRFGGNTAFVEGWGLYAESLGREAGVLDDPYQYFGYLDSELFRAIRLVVDTGIHAKGWSREQAIDYILKNSSRGRSNAVAETERYIAMPGQALAYKTGQMKIRALRTRAEAALGPKFDVREFHDQVLGSGALPLAVLEAKVDRWVAGKR
jgi:uncharacterized protein (DUF885 family)